MISTSGVNVRPCADTVNLPARQRALFPRGAQASMHHQTWQKLTRATLVVLRLFIFRIFGCWFVIREDIGLVKGGELTGFTSVRGPER